MSLRPWSRCVKQLLINQESRLRHWFTRAALLQHSSGESVCARCACLATTGPLKRIQKDNENCYLENLGVRPRPVYYDDSCETEWGTVGSGVFTNQAAKYDTWIRNWTPACRWRHTVDAVMPFGEQRAPAVSSSDCVQTRTRPRFYTNASKQEPIVYSMYEVDNVLSDTFHEGSLQEYHKYTGLQPSSFVFWYSRKPNSHPSTHKLLPRVQLVLNTLFLHYVIYADSVQSYIGVALSISMT